MQPRRRELVEACHWLAERRNFRRGEGSTGRLNSKPVARIRAVGLGDAESFGRVRSGRGKSATLRARIRGSGRRAHRRVRPPGLAAAAPSPGSRRRAVRQRWFPPVWTVGDLRSVIPVAGRPGRYPRLPLTRRSQVPVLIQSSTVRCRRLTASDAGRHWPASQDLPEVGEPTSLISLCVGRRRARQRALLWIFARGAFPRPVEREGASDTRSRVDLGRRSPRRARLAAAAAD